MDNKDFKTYLNEAKSKISSVETCITEAHALAENNDKTEVENIMKSLQNINSSINDIMK